MQSVKHNSQLNIKEAMDAPPPPPIHFDPPAQVQHVDAPAGSFKSYYHASFMPTASFINYIKKVENGVKAGYKNGIWHPHKSVEGGTDTIAYGHKLHSGDNFSKGITDEEATKLLIKDILKASDTAKHIVNKNYGVGTYESLPDENKEMLVDYAFNGVINKFPQFVDGVVNNDMSIMTAQYKRYVNGKELTGRNSAFASRYFN